MSIVEGEGYRLIEGDCLVANLPYESCAVVTDPPYGLDSSDWRGNFSGNNGQARLWGKQPQWDIVTEELRKFVVKLAIAKQAIIWGGNYYPLPPTKCWLIWDKVQEFSSADCELAWTNLDMVVRAFRMSRIDAYVNKAATRKIHPTEKPVSLLEWCLSFLPGNCTVIDPFMGSGSTGVACIKTGRSFVGYEIDPCMFALAARRIEDASRAARGLPKQLTDARRHDDLPLFMAGIGEDAPEQIAGGAIQQLAQQVNRPEVNG